MPYLLDTNALITAKNGPYRFSVCPGFWDWLETGHKSGLIHSIDRIKSELIRGNDDLADWAAARPPTFFLAAEPALQTRITVLAVWAEAGHFDAAAIAVFMNSADLYLVAHAHHLGFTVVTHETPDPKSKKRVKIPDACKHLGVTWINPYQMLENEGARFVLATSSPRAPQPP